MTVEDREVPESTRIEEFAAVLAPADGSDKPVLVGGHAANLNHDQLQQLSDEVGPGRSLLVVCSAFRGRKEGYPNLTVKKIPKSVLSRCEFGKDDYSLKVENLPKAPPKPEQMDLL